MEKIVVANLKMNLGEKEIKKYVSVINNKNFNNIKLYIAPSYLYLDKFNSNNYILTSQNVSSHINGAYTGEISASQLKSIGVKAVIVGHSERRKLFDEDYKIINEKIKLCLENNLGVILCVGEEKRKDLNESLNEIITEVKKDINGINKLNNLIIAYEPVYAINSGKTLDLKDIKFICDNLKDKFKTKVIYGGSVNNENIKEICNITDGVIVGHMSLNVQYFCKMLDKNL